MKRGEIWLVNLDPTLGAEIRKTRPALVVNDDELGVLPLRVIVPITDWKPHYAGTPWLVELVPDIDNGLSKPSAADCFQVRSVATVRFMRRLGTVPNSFLSDIETALAKVLHIQASGKTSSGFSAK